MTTPCIVFYLETKISSGSIFPLRTMRTAEGQYLVFFRFGLKIQLQKNRRADH